jgi:hypothetical protein
VIARLLVALALICATPSCGPSARTRTLQVTLAATTAAQAGFIAQDAARQQAIIDRATSLDEGRIVLHEYRLKRDRVVALFVATYRAVAVAATAQDGDLTDAVTASRELAAALAALFQEAP